MDRRGPGGKITWFKRGVLAGGLMASLGLGSEMIHDLKSNDKYEDDKETEEKVPDAGQNDAQTKKDLKIIDARLQRNRAAELRRFIQGRSIPGDEFYTEKETPAQKAKRIESIFANDSELSTFYEPRHIQSFNLDDLIASEREDEKIDTKINIYMGEDYYNDRIEGYKKLGLSGQEMIFQVRSRGTKKDSGVYMVDLVMLSDGRFRKYEDGEGGPSWDGEAFDREQLNVELAVLREWYILRGKMTEQGDRIR